MYAIVETGGRQLKVRKGQTVTVDNPNLTPGEDFRFDKVLFYSDEQGDLRIGKPMLDNVTVTGTCSNLVKGPKLVVCKFRRRKNSKTKTGHRQHYGSVRINDISAS